MFASNTLQIPEMLPIKEVSERTGLSYNYLRCLCLRGEIAHIRTGKKYLINFSAFIDYLNTSGKEVRVDDEYHDL